MPCREGHKPWAEVAFGPGYDEAGLIVFAEARLILCEMTQCLNTPQSVSPAAV